MDIIKANICLLLTADMYVSQMGTQKVDSGNLIILNVYTIQHKSNTRPICHCLWQTFSHHKGLERLALEEKRFLAHFIASLILSEPQNVPSLLVSSALSNFPKLTRVYVQERGPTTEFERRGGLKRSGERIMQRGAKI